MILLRFIPNFLTLTNLFFGCLAVYYGIMGDLETLAYLVLAGMFCDFFDGFFARQFKIDSQLGIQLDSLSDLVTFGLTSSVVMLQLIESSSYVVNNSSISYVKFVPFIAFLITVASSYRLAKFNVNSIDSNFKGLPTPANALLIVFIPFFIDYFEISTLFQNIYLLVFLVLISSSLLVSNLNMFSFKLKNLSFKENKLIYLFVLVSILLIAVFGFASIPIIVVIYIITNFLRLIL